MFPIRVAACHGLLAAVLLAGGLASCGSDPGEEGAGEKPAEPTPALARVVGEIASVHESEGFVLIRRIGVKSLPAGSYMSIGTDGRTAALRLTGERLGRYFAADVLNGTPAREDVVVVRRLPSESRPDETPADPIPRAPVPSPSGAPMGGF